MREVLSDLLVEYAKKDERVVVLSGDHGYALFDAIRKERPKQFLNVGVMEQAMVGFAAGLAKVGFLPVVYGLSAFIPVRVLEQIKLDVCHSKLPVIFLGDGAGLVYSTLGTSHQCGEDVACLRPVPSMRIYGPSDSEELKVCFKECFDQPGPAYLRIGKSDRPLVNESVLASTKPHFVTTGSRQKRHILVSFSSMLSLSAQIGSEYGVDTLSIPRIKPMHDELLELLDGYEEVSVVEEHSRYGGLASAIMDFFAEKGVRPPKVRTLALQDHFAFKCGSYQFALSEHDLSDEQVGRRLGEIFEG